MGAQKVTKLFGPPGTGKTTKSLSIVEEHLAAGVKPEKIGYFSFTQKAANEARERAMSRFGLPEKSFPFFRTIHSLVFRQLGMRREQVISWQHWRELGDKLGMRFEGRTQVEDGSLYGMGRDDRIKFMESLSRTKKEPLQKTWEAANEDDIGWHEVDLFARSLAEYKRNRGLYDFNDMLDQFVLQADKPRMIPWLDVMIVDEAQDLSRSQWEVYARLATRAGRIYVAGDDDQCSVKGTKVLTSIGEVNVEHLDPSIHRLVCYDQNSAEMVGFRNGYNFEIQETNHDGTIYTVSAGRKSTSTTLNHKWLVRWSQKAKDEKPCVVYLMRRGDRYRVGWCQLFRSDGCLHLCVRANHEKADAAWILHVAKDRTDASVQESIIAAKYGLPTIPFEPVKGATHLTQEAIDRIFERLAGKEHRERAQSCLWQFDLNMNYPVWSRDKVQRFGSLTFEAETCNLLSDLMTVPVFSGEKRPRWEPIQVVRSYTQTTVYGLKVDKHKNYVADGIVTHNCIYDWAGADVNEFLKLGGDIQILDQSYRVPSKVHKTALAVSGRIKNRQPKTWKAREGECGAEQWHMDPADVDISAGQWLLLARNGYMLAELEEMCLGAGYSFASVGHSPLDAPSLKAILIWEKLRKGLKLPADEVAKALGFMKRTVTLPRTSTPLGIAELQALGLQYQGEIPIWHQALDRIPTEERDYFIAARRRGETLNKKPRISISTIHAAKGGEADNVMLLTDVSSRSFETLNQKPDAEARVFYVAITRTMKNLHMIEPRTGMYYQI